MLSPLCFKNQAFDQPSNGMPQTITLLQEQFFKMYCRVWQSTYI